MKGSGGGGMYLSSSLSLGVKSSSFSSLTFADEVDSRSLSPLFSFSLLLSRCSFSESSSSSGEFRDESKKKLRRICNIIGYVSRAVLIERTLVFF